MKKLLFTLLGLAAALTLPAQDFKITHGPWLCDMTEDGVTVLWTTNKPALSWVEATEDDGRSFYAAEHTRHYETVEGCKQAHKTLHAVRLNNLRPGTKYCYRIFSQEVLEWKHGDNVLYGRTVASNVYKRAPFRFRTFPATGTDCSFVILNDIHGRADDMTELCREINFGKHDFVMLNGDMSSSIENEEQLFRDFIDASVNLYASETPILYNRGNHETVGEDAARLVVAAGEENRRPGSEKRGRSVEVVLEKLLPALDAARHVAVESHESQFGKVHAFAEPGQDVGLAVDVVQHEERASGTRSRKGAEPVGPAPRRIGADSLSIGDVVDVGPRLNLLRKDPVTVVGPGLQPPDTNGVQRPAGQLAAGDGLVMARRRCGRKAVGGRRLDPRKRGPVGGPDHRHSVLRHVAQVRPVRNSEFLCGGRQCEGQSRKHEKQFLHPISG